MTMRWGFMSDLLAFCMTISVALAGACVVGYQNGITEQVAAKAGLQQCLENGRVLWQNECKQ